MKQMTYYHYTNIANIPNILKTKMLKDTGIGVYVCNSKEEILKFVTFYATNMRIKIEDTKIIGFKSNSTFEESFDHNPKYFDRAKAFVCNDNVKISNIKIYDFL